MNDKIHLYIVKNRILNIFFIFQMKKIKLNILFLFSIKLKNLLIIFTKNHNYFI